MEKREKLGRLSKSFLKILILILFAAFWVEMLLLASHLQHVWSRSSLKIESFPSNSAEFEDAKLIIEYPFLHKPYFYVELRIVPNNNFEGINLRLIGIENLSEKDIYDVRIDGDLIKPRISLKNGEYLINISEHIRPHEPCRVTIWNRRSIPPGKIVVSVEEPVDDLDVYFISTMYKYSCLENCVYSDKFETEIRFGGDETVILAEGDNIRKGSLTINMRSMFWYIVFYISLTVLIAIGGIIVEKVLLIIWEFLNEKRISEEGV